MPELPEVETTRRGLAPHVEGRSVTGVVLRRPDLRWPIPPEISDVLPGQRIEAVRRRAKYLLLDTAAGSALLHLGMSGSLRVVPADTPVDAHDHVDLALDSGRLLRFNDPRRFGCLLWQPPGRNARSCCAGSGPEPLSDDFDGDYLFAAQPRPQRAGEDLPDGPAHRGRRRQHLRGRSAVRGRHLAAARRRPVSRERYGRSPTRCSRSSRHAIDARRHHPARFHQPGRRSPATSSRNCPPTAAAENPARAAGAR